MTKKSAYSKSSVLQTRRAFVKTGAALGTVALAAPMIIRPSMADDKVINWLAYSGHSADEVVGPFKEATGITINAKEYADGEKMLALIHGSPKGTFDMVTSDAPYVELLVKAGLLQEMNPGDYAMDDFFPEFRNWEQHWFDSKLMALTTSWGYNGLAYNTEKLFRPTMSPPTTSCGAKRSRASSACVTGTCRSWVASARPWATRTPTTSPTTSSRR